MSDMVQLDEKNSGKSKQSSRHTKKSGNKQENNDIKDNNSKNSQKEIKNTENAEETENKQPSPSLPQQVISTRAYLEQNVTPVVQEALLECARKRPDNPLEFVGNYILNRAHGK